MGCRVKWKSNRTIKIIGVNKLKNVNYKVMFDRIEAGTYLIASAITEGNLKIKDLDPKIIRTEIETLKKAGATIRSNKSEIHIIGKKTIKNLRVKTAPYPGFPTDLQAQIMALLCKANKKSEIIEEIFENRFMHVAELNRMGAKIFTVGNKAIINGPISFMPAETMATDLRASVSLILAALNAKGKQLLTEYIILIEDMKTLKKIKKVGAKIRRVN